MQNLEQVFLWFTSHFIFLIVLVLLIFFFIKSQLSSDLKCIDCGGTLQLSPEHKNVDKGTYECKKCGLKCSPEIMKTFFN